MLNSDASNVTFSQKSQLSGSDNRISFQAGPRQHSLPDEPARSHNRSHSSQQNSVITSEQAASLQLRIPIAKNALLSRSNKPFTQKFNRVPGAMEANQLNYGMRIARKPTAAPLINAQQPNEQQANKDQKQGEEEEGALGDSFEFPTPILHLSHEAVEDPGFEKAIKPYNNRKVIAPKAGVDSLNIFQPWTMADSELMDSEILKGHKEIIQQAIKKRVAHHGLSDFDSALLSKVIESPGAGKNEVWESEDSFYFKSIDGISSIWNSRSQDWSLILPDSEQPERMRMVASFLGKKLIMSIEDRQKALAQLTSQKLYEGISHKIAQKKRAKEEEDKYVKADNAKRTVRRERKMIKDQKDLNAVRIDAVTTHAPALGFARRDLPKLEELEEENEEDSSIRGIQIRRGTNTSTTTKSSNTTDVAIEALTRHKQLMQRGILAYNDGQKVVSNQKVVFDSTLQQDYYRFQ